MELDKVLKYGVTSKQDFLLLAEAQTYPFNKMSSSNIESFAETLIFDQTMLRGFNFKMLKDKLSFQEFIAAYDVLFAQKVYFEFDNNSFDRNWVELLNDYNKTLGGLRTYPNCKLDKTPLPVGCGDRKDDCCVF